MDPINLKKDSHRFCLNIPVNNLLCTRMSHIWVCSIYTLIEVTGINWWHSNSEGGTGKD
jgi:hypothetical protein